MVVKDFHRQQHARRSTPQHTPECNPACGSYERCIATMNPCTDCPPAQCVSLASLEMPTVAQSRQDNGNRSSQVALIAGLTTGLAVGAAVIVTVAGFVYYRKRRRQQQQQKQQDIQQQEHEPKPYFKPMVVGLPPPAVTLPTTMMDDPFRPIWSSSPSYQLPQHPPQSPPIPLQDAPQSPVFMGTSALHIPRLQSPPSTATTSSTTIRRSLSLLHSGALSPPTINRSSSVKVTKYDYRTDEIVEESPADDEVAPVLRRAISVRKNNTTNTDAAGGLSRSASTGSSPALRGGRLLAARPTMVQIVTKKMDNGVSRKASVRSANITTATSSTTAIGNSSSCLLTGDDDIKDSSSSSSGRVRTNSWGSQVSGEITVVWDGPSPEKK